MLHLAHHALLSTRKVPAIAGMSATQTCCRYSIDESALLIILISRGGGEEGNRRDSLGTRCLLGTTSLTNLVLTRTYWRPFRVNMSGLFKFGQWALIESLLIYLIP